MWSIFVFFKDTFYFPLISLVVFPLKYIFISIYSNLKIIKNKLEAMILYVIIRAHIIRL